MSAGFPAQRQELATNVTRTSLLFGCGLLLPQDCLRSSQYNCGSPTYCLQYFSCRHLPRLFPHRCAIYDSTLQSGQEPEQMHLLVRVVAPVTCKIERPVLSCPIGEMTYRPGYMHARGTVLFIAARVPCWACSAAHFVQPRRIGHFGRPSGDVLGVDASQVASQMTYGAGDTCRPGYVVVHAAAGDFFEKWR